MIEWLKTHWFLLAALVAMGAAWGENKVKVLSLEQAVQQQTQIAGKVEEQGKAAAAIDERTKLMLEAQKEQQRILIQILQQVQR